MVGWLQELTARWHPHLHHLSQHQPFLHVYSTILSIRSAAPGRLNSIFCGMVPRRWIAGKHALSESLCLWTYSVLCRACQSIPARDHHPAALCAQPPRCIDEFLGVPQRTSGLCPLLPSSTPCCFPHSALAGSSASAAAMCSYSRIRPRSRHCTRTNGHGEQKDRMRM